MWKQSDDGVLRCMLASISGLRPQLYTGVRGFSSVKEGLVEEQQMSTYPKGHWRRGGHESGQNLKM